LAPVGGRKEIMIEMIYKATCDRCPSDEPDFVAEYSRKEETILRSFINRIQKMGWTRIEGQWVCPSCVRSVSVLNPPKVRKDPPKKAGKLSKAAREALAQRLIDDGS